MGAESFRDLRAVVEMPLRDVIRGLHRASDLSRDLIERTLSMAPSAMRDPIRRSLEDPVDPALENAPPPDAAVIARAAAWLDGDADASLAAFVAAFDWAVHGVLRREGADFLIFSETVAALALSAHDPRAGAETPALCAAATIAALTRAHALGRAPGLPLPERRGVDAPRRLAYNAAALWLLADRPAEAGDEVLALEAARLLTRTEDDRLRAAEATEDAYASALADLARIV